VRILLFTDALPELARGGLDLHVQELATALAAEDLEVVTYTARGQQSGHGGPAAQLARRLSQGSEDSTLGAFDAVLAEKQPDLVHIHSLQGLSHRLPERAVRFGIPVVWTLHDLYSICPRSHLHDGHGKPCSSPQLGAACGPCFGGLKGLLAAPVFGLRYAGYFGALHRCDRLIAPSQYIADVLLGEGVNSARIEVLPPGLPAPIRLAEPGGMDGACRFVFAGDLREAKGADLAVAAVTSLQEPSIHLELHGGAPAPPAPREVAYEDRLRQAATGSSVNFHGRYEPEKLLSILDGAAALIVPSRVRESFGRTANLALQAGVPVIAANHGALPEFIYEGVNGCLFEPGEVDSLADAMQRILERGLELQAEIESWPETPQLEHHTEALIQLYGALI
tara:strand:- start:300 stop:1481 length:1182 start_codon:yes stop_codon:yes gene_type:complete